MINEILLPPGSPRAYSFEAIPFRPDSVGQILSMFQIFRAYMLARRYYENIPMHESITPPSKTIELTMQLVNRLTLFFQDCVSSNQGLHEDYQQAVEELSLAIRRINEQVEVLSQGSLSRKEHRADSELTPEEAQAIDAVDQELETVTGNLKQIAAAVGIAKKSQELSQQTTQVTYNSPELSQ